MSRHFTKKEQLLWESSPVGHFMVGKERIHVGKLCRCVDVSNYLGSKGEHDQIEGVF